AFFWLRPLYLAQGALKAWVTIAAVAVVLSLAGFFAAIPLWGFQGLAIWLMLVTLITHGTAALYLGRQRKLAT
ncbi:MAG TPA: hypothetical protein VLX11_11055, partial [Candidatus Acidoferrales bacterium]|nr:hypothetical protein [Candidatus Acidoferrales bacterium]